MSFTIEDLGRVLTHKNIEIIPSDAEGGELFNRNRRFIVNGTQYKICWYSNVSYLYCGDIIVPFHAARQSGSWPSRKKLNLQFYDARGDVCCILGIEDWPEVSA